MGLSQLPALNAREVTRALERAGFLFDRQSGSHAVYIHPSRHRRTVIPMHGGRTIKKPLLRSIIDDMGISIEEFLELL
ncbi:type II toxin-antitoxin system HicA family toxin [Candidatus Uhrbacteria bacterium]|nr:type II toxin-antitoxin system HicA family toxin [Candidatus Uhrbacteria bacterium]